jgi:hypothetical protein
VSLLTVTDVVLWMCINLTAVTIVSANPPSTATHVARTALGFGYRLGLNTVRRRNKRRKKVYGSG